jgi:hypothetical protein
MSNFQNITAVKLCHVAITTIEVAVYTTPTLTKTYVKQFDICNTTSGALTVNVHIVPVGNTVGTANAIYYVTSVPANSLLQWRGIQVMNAGDTLQVKGSAVGLTLTASGGEAV